MTAARLALPVLQHGAHLEDLRPRRLLSRAWRALYHDDPAARVEAVHETRKLAAAVLDLVERGEIGGTEQAAAVAMASVGGCAGWLRGQWHRTCPGTTATTCAGVAVVLAATQGEDLEGRPEAWADEPDVREYWKHFVRRWWFRCVSRLAFTAAPAGTFTGQSGLPHLARPSAETSDQCEHDELVEIWMHQPNDDRRLAPDLLELDSGRVLPRARLAADLRVSPNG